MAQTKLLISVDFRKSDNALLKAAAQFFLEELLKDANVSGTLHISITGKVTNPEHMGAVSPVKRKGVKWYDITLSKQCHVIDLIKTLAHECVHVVQFADGRLHGYVNWLWKGTNYGRNPYNGVDDADALPWESEAYSTERLLAKKFINNYLNSW